MAQGKVALITGGGTGIGQAAALALQGDGWNVAITGRRKGELDKTVGHGQGRRGDDGGYPGRRGPARRCESACSPRLGQAFGGRLDFPVQQRRHGRPAGVYGGPTYEQWTAVVNVNLTGSFLCAQEAIKIMKSQSSRGGRIVNNGSISAYTPRPNSVPYTATKHAITGLTKCIALDGRKYDIACGQLDVGNADTALGGRMKAGVPQANGEIKPEPVMDVAHCGSAIRYMASLPLDANVLFMNIKATKMPFEGRG